MGSPGIALPLKPPIPLQVSTQIHMGAASKPSLLLTPNPTVDPPPIPSMTMCPPAPGAPPEALCAPPLELDPPAPPLSALRGLRDEHAAAMMVAKVAGTATRGLRMAKTSRVGGPRSGRPRWKWRCVDPGGVARRHPWPMIGARVANQYPFTRQPPNLIPTALAPPLLPSTLAKSLKSRESIACSPPPAPENIAKILEPFRRRILVGRT
jgi:hypothetical protein